MNTATTAPAAQGAAEYTFEAVDSLGNPQVARAQLTQDQVNELIDTAKRLQGMAIFGVPTVAGASMTGLQMDLALHALLTAFISLADAFPLHTGRAASMCDRAAISLQSLAVRRANLFPQQIQ